MQIPSEDTLDEFRRLPRCEWCKRPTPDGCHPHHLFCRGTGGGSRLDLRLNLIGLCWRCHGEHHQGHQPMTNDLLAVVSARENCSQDAIRHAIRDIRALPRHSSQEAIDALLPLKTPQRPTKGKIARPE